MINPVKLFTALILCCGAKCVFLKAYWYLKSIPTLANYAQFNIVLIVNTYNPPNILLNIKKIMFRYHFGNGRKKSFIELPDGSNLEPHSTIMSEESSEAINDARSGRSGTVRPFKNRMNESPVSLAVKHSISKNYDLERCQRDCRIWNKVYPHLLAHVLINKKNPKEFRYVMPHLGISLAEFNPATIEENLQIQLVAIKALKQLHRKGVAHGDINLGNILITKVISSGTISYQAYIIDFESSHTTDVPDSDTLKSRTKDDIQNKMRMDIAKLAHILRCEPWRAEGAGE